MASPAYSVSELLTLDCDSESYDTKLDIKHRGRPTPNIKFDGKRQCRLVEHYEKWKWLCGCLERKALFCFPCLIFKRKKHLSWTDTGMRDVSNLTQNASKHSRSEAHLSAVTALNLLGKVRIHEAIQEGAYLHRQRYNLEVGKNREMMKHHIRAVLFLVTQGLALRGHDEHKTSTNRGNFVELVKEFVEFSGNEKVIQALHEDSPVFTGFSHEIQNDIIQCINDLVLMEIKQRVQKAACLTIMADETTDVSNSSQMAVSVRLVYNGVVYEHLIDVVDVSSDRTASVLAKEILNSLERRVGVSKDTNVIGQSYDGAANMAGRIHSVQTIIKHTWPQARFVHCYAHKWALVVRNTCEALQKPCLFFGHIQNLCNFFRASPKRARLLTGVLPGSCPTRWLTRGKSVSAIESKYEEIQTVLENIVNETGKYDAKTKAEAMGLLSQMRQVENIFLLKVFKRILGMSNIVSRMLQNPNIDGLTISKKLDDYKRHLNEMRSESCFQEIWTKVLKYDSHMPRTRKTPSKLNTDTGYSQATESSVGVETSMRALLFELVDRLTEEINVRFADIERFQWMQLLHPDNFRAMQSDPVFVQQLISGLKILHPSVVPDTSSFHSQLNILYGDSQVQEAISGTKDFATLLHKMHALELTDALPDVSKALIFCVSTGITSVACERSFSVLRRVKSYSRSSMSAERTKQLLFLSVESRLAKEMSRDNEFLDRIIDRFAHMKQRRINLVYKM